MRINIAFFLLVCVWVLGFSVVVQAQTSSLAIGSWQLHVPNNRAKALAEVEDKIYCATEDGFFLYDKSFNQLKTLSKSDGFSDFDISTLAYEPQTKTLLIAYENTNIDLLREEEIININDILRKNIPGQKQIYHIYFQDKVAYLACSFGLVLLDLVKLEIKDTYSNLGPNGQTMQVYASTILNDSLYLATSNGIMAARRSNNNLLDYRNWRTFNPSDGLPLANPQDFRTITAFNNKVFSAVNNHALYRFNGNNWVPTAINLQNKVSYQLTTYKEYLLLVDNEKLLFLDKSNQISVKDGTQVNQPRAALFAGNDVFWVADYENGLVQITGSESKAYIPSGPMFNRAFRLYADKEQVYVLGGGYDQSYEQLNLTTGFSVFRSGQWENFNPQQYPDAVQFPPVQDLVSALRSPVNQKLYLASYGFGLIEWEGPGKFKVYNPDNSPLKSAIPGNNGYTRIPDLALDAMGNIWMTNRNQLTNEVGLHALHTDGTWQSYRFPGFADGSNLERIIVDNNNYKWITVSRNGSSSRGILVFDEIQNQFRHLTTNPVLGNLPGLDVYDLALDKDGFIWVGTDKGVAVFYEPEAVFGNNVAASTPIINRRPLLENLVVTTIAIDAGNRKWVGTETGIWLFNADGDAVISQFTTDNSPLPSNRILDISIHNGTGEVFISTEAGLVSYRGTATETTGKPDCAIVFPNPVRPDYTGLIGISGLPNNAEVKITDITGALVYQTRATGGSVAWDVKDLKGKRVKSGVYLAFSASSDGSQSCISKIAVVE